MPGADDARALLLTIGANDEAFRRTINSARAAMETFASAMDSQVGVVEDRLDGFRAPGFSASIKQMQQEFESSFSSIQRMASQAISAPRTAGGSLDVGAAQLRASQAAAENKAVALREIATAAERAAIATDDTSQATRVYVQAARAAAIEAEGQARGFALQAQAAEVLQLELNRTASTTVRVRGEVERTGHSFEGAGASTMIFQHVVRSTADSFAAGLPLTMIFGEQIGRLGEAAALSGGAMGKVGAFLAGPWGIAMTAGVAVLGVLISHLHDAQDAAQLAKVGDDGLATAQAQLGRMFDLTTGKLQHQNEMLRLNAQLTAVNLRAQASQERASSTKTFGEAGQPSLWTRFLDTLALDGPGGPNGLSRYRGRRDTNVSSMRGTVQAVESGKMSKEDALRLSEKQDFTGTQVTREQFQQAIIDAASAPLKDKIADEIDKSLKTGTLDQDLRNEPRAKKPKKPKVDHTAEHAANADHAYQVELNTAQQGYARALLALSDTAEARLQVQKDELQDALRQRVLELDDQVKAKKISAAEADYLKVIAQRTTALQIEAAQRAERSAVLQRQAKVDQDSLSAQIDMLRLQEGLADTAAQKRPIELRILELERRLELAKQQEIIDDPTSKPEQVKAAEAQKAQIALQFPLKQQQVEQQTAGPLDAYRQQLSDNVGDMNTALQGVAVDGLKGLEDGLNGLVTGTETAAQAFSKMATSIISDLARIGIEKAFLAILGGPTTLLADGGEVMKLAGGGPVFGAGGPRDDKVHAMLSAGEYVVNAEAYAQHPALVEAINSGRLPRFADGGLVGARAIVPARIPDMAQIGDMRARAAGGAPITIDLRGAVVTQDLLAQVNTIVARGSMVAMVGGSQMAQQDLAEQRMQAIPT